MLTVFDKSFEPNTSLKDKLTYLDGTYYLTSFRAASNELQNATVKIKYLLESGRTRLEGLTLLKTVLSQCTVEVFSNNAIAWAQSAIEVLKSTDSCVCKELSCNILSRIVSNLSHCPGLRADVTNRLLPALIPTLLQITSEDEWLFLVMKCLAVCMQRFPGQLGSYKNGIEGFLLKHLDTLLTQNTEVVAECFAELPACSERGTNPKVYCDNWLIQFHQVVNTLHSLLNDLGLSIDDGSQRSNSILHAAEFCELQLPPYPEDMCSCIFLQARQFSTITRCLAKMLSSHARHTVQMPVQPVLDILSRILALSTGKMKDTACAETHLIVSLVPGMQCAAFVLLESLILCGHTYLINHAELIETLFVHSLKTSKENIHPVSLLRCTIYKVLTVWLYRLGAKGSLAIVKNSYIISELLSDITPDGCYKEPSEARSPVVLKSAKKDKMSTMETLTNIIEDDPQLSTCIQALKVLSSIIYIGGPFMESKILEDIQKNVLSILNEIQYKQPAPSLYSDERCRKKLYGLLLATVINPSPHLKQPLQASVRLFKVGLRDPSVHVSGFCHRAFTICKTTLHPRKAPPQLLCVPKENCTKTQEVLTDGRLEMPVDNSRSWQMNGSILKFTPAEKFQQMQDHNKMESQMPPMSNAVSIETVPVANYNKHGEGCNGNDHILHNSSHEDNESIDEESEEDVDEERSFCEEVDNGLPMLNESSVYVSPRNSVSSHVSLQGNQHLHPTSTPHHDYDELGAENNMRSAQGDCNNTSVNQNGLYDSSEDEDVEDDADLENEYIVSKESSKRASEHSFEIPAKKHHTMNVDEESEDEDIDEAEEECEQNAMDMIEDFMPCSPDESQS